MQSSFCQASVCVCVVTVERKWGKVRLEHAHSRLFPLNLCELDHLARQRGGGIHKQQTHLLRSHMWPALKVEYK